MDMPLQSLVLFVLVAAFTPGPNNIMIMASGLNFGTRRSFPHLLGICFGVPTLIIALGLGLAQLFETLPLVHEVIRVIGLAYLLYLAWRIATAPAPGEVDGRGRPFTFVEAALFQWVNPKAWIMGSGAIAAFTNQAQDMAPQIILMGLVFLLLTAPAVACWMMLGRFLQKLIRKASYRRFFNISMAFLLLLSIAPVLWEIAKKYVFI